MKTRNLRRFYGLLKQHVKVSGLDAKELKEQFVSEMSSGRTTSLQELDDVEYAALLGAMEAKLGAIRDADGDMWRKRVIAVGCEYFELMGLYRDLSPRERVEKAKGMAVKATGRATRFNEITVTELQGLYYGGRRKNNVLANSNKQFARDLSGD